MTNEMILGNSVLPDLYVYTGGDFADGICLSVSTSVISQSGPFSTDDTLYLSFGVANGSSVEAGPFAASVYLDGILVYAMESTQPLGHAARTKRAFLLGALPAGEHTLTIVCDDYNAVKESNKSNNVLERTFTILPGECEPSRWLLSTLWKQRGDGATSYEFNAYVPQGLRTGCTPTAVGQILQYWWQKGYEVSLHIEADDFFAVKTKDASYTIDMDNLLEYCGIDDFTINALLTDTAFEKSNVDSDGTIGALELLCMLVMHSTVMDDETTTIAFRESEVLERAGFSYECIPCTGGVVPWERIKENIAAGMPVLAGLGGSLGHTVVFDGYDAEKDSWHINFGWGAADYRRYDEKLGFDTGTGWYSQEEMGNFSITALTLDISPSHENIQEPATTIDWSWKIYDSLEPEAGYLVTLYQAGGSAIILDVAESGLNVVACQSSMSLSVESVTGIALERSRSIKVACDEGETPVLLETPDNDFADIFFVRTCGVWNGNFSAKNINDGELFSMTGMNRFCDIFCSVNDSSILYLTDDDNGDAFFADDIYTDSYENMGSQNSRFTGIREICAGAGSDLVDLTSGRFDCENGIIVRGGAGGDVLWGGGNGCILFGDNENDILVGTAGDDILVGGQGNDTIRCLGGDDIICFGLTWGNDTVYQTDDGNLDLWFKNGSVDYWDCQSQIYDDGVSSVSVVGAASISLHFGKKDDPETYSYLAALEAFV